MIQAAALLNEGDLAVKLFDLVNPIHHSDSPQKADLYKVEPYVIAADVYSNVQHKGRGGWTWYTGSASWMYRVAIESILGIQIESDRIVLRPAVPKSWPGFSIQLPSWEDQFGMFMLSTGHRIRNANKPLVIELVEDGMQHDIELSYG